MVGRDSVVLNPLEQAPVVVLHEPPVQHDLELTAGEAAAPQRLTRDQRQSTLRVLDVAQRGKRIEIGLYRKLTVPFPLDHLKRRNETQVGFKVNKLMQMYPKCILTWNPFKSVKKTSPDFTPEVILIAISLLFIVLEVRSMSFSIISPVPSTPGLLWRQTTCLIQASVTVTQDLRRPSIILTGCFVSSLRLPGPSERRKNV